MVYNEGLLSFSTFIVRTKTTTFKLYAMHNKLTQHLGTIFG